MRYVYIEFKPNFRTIHILADHGLNIQIIINRSLMELLNHSKYIPEDYFDNLNFYYNIDYLEPHIVKIKNKDYIEIEWLPSYIHLTVTIRKDWDYAHDIEYAKNYHHLELDADVIWAS